MSRVALMFSSRVQSFLSLLLSFLVFFIVPSSEHDNERKKTLKKGPRGLKTRSKDKECWGHIHLYHFCIIPWVGRREHRFAVCGLLSSRVSFLLYYYYKLRPSQKRVVHPTPPCVFVCLGREKRKKAVLPPLCVVHQTQMFKLSSPQKHTRKKNAPICLLQRPSHPFNDTCLFLSFPSMHIDLSRSWRCIYHNVGPTWKTLCEKKKWTKEGVEEEVE